jgi:hypothetical protein
MHDAENDDADLCQPATKEQRNAEQNHRSSEELERPP